MEKYLDLHEYARIGIILTGLFLFGMYAYLIPQTNFFHHESDSVITHEQYDED